jgi:hypothetical protein
MKTRSVADIKTFWRWLDHLEHDFNKEPDWIKGSATNRGSVQTPGPQSQLRHQAASPRKQK